MKTVEELLKPRYKVIADYPNCSYEVGRVVTPDSSLWINSDEVTLCSPDVDKYPHLFKKLEWWESRTMREMPEYVNWDGEVHRPEWVLNEYGFFYELSDGKTYWASNTIPATESEYLSQQK